MNQKIFRQYDGSWAKKPYPTKGCTVAGAGCGLVACTHIAIEQERYKNWTPNNLRPWMVNKGFAVVNQGTRWEGITQTLKHLGHENVVRIYNDPMTEAWKELNKGNRIGVILFDSSYAPNGIQWTSCGHYVAFTDYKIKDGKHLFYCKDSGGRKHDGWYSYERSMKNCVSKMWIVERINPVTATAPSGITPDGKLITDGVGGTSTAIAMQRFFGTPIDGVIGGQRKSLKKYYSAMTAVVFGKGGSTVVRAMQKWLGIPEDGIWGKGTSKALQKKLGVKEDGKFGTVSMKAWQKYLNEHDKAVYPIKPKKKKTKCDLVADMAESYVGLSRYVKGGTNIKTGVDCTGFVREMGRLALGIKLPASLKAWGKSIGTDLSKAKPGYVITYRSKKTHELKHHSIYVGGGKCVHACGSHKDHSKDIIKSGCHFSGLYIEGIRNPWK